MKVLFTGGGTFGHIAPALAAAQALKEARADIEIAFVGRRGGAENAAIRRAGYPLYELSVQGIQRKLSMQSLRATFSTLKAFGEAKKMIEKIRPDLVFGTGGYVCFPMMRAAIRYGIPTLLHESNATPGRACRMLAPHCTKVLLGTRDCLAEMPRRAQCEFTGNPIRKEFSEYTRQQARKILGISEKDRLLLSFGGSGGAERLNDTMMDFIMKKDERKNNLYHIHACGKKYYGSLAERYPMLTAKNARARLYPFIENMPLYMCAADLCVCRSGAMTVAELCASALPSILVPSPNVTNNHQYKNAYSLSQGGGALICKEEALSEIGEMIFETLSNKAELEKMSKAASRYGNPAAAEQIATCIISHLP